MSNKHVDLLDGIESIRASESPKTEARKYINHLKSGCAKCSYNVALTKELMELFYIAELKEDTTKHLTKQDIIRLNADRMGFEEKLSAVQHLSICASCQKIFNDKYLLAYGNQLQLFHTELAFEKLKGRLASSDIISNQDPSIHSNKNYQSTWSRFKVCVPAAAVIGIALVLVFMWPFGDNTENYTSIENEKEISNRTTRGRDSDTQIDAKKTAKKVVHEQNYLATDKKNKTQNESTHTQLAMKQLNGIEVQENKKINTKNVKTKGEEEFQRVSNYSQNGILDSSTSSKRKRQLKKEKKTKTTVALEDVTSNSSEYTPNTNISLELNDSTIKHSSEKSLTESAPSDESNEERNINESIREMKEKVRDQCRDRNKNPVKFTFKRSAETGALYQIWSPLSGTGIQCAKKVIENEKFPSTKKYEKIDYIIYIDIPDESNEERR